MENKIMIIDTEAISLTKRYIYDIGIIVAEWDSEKRQYIAIEKHQWLIKQIWDNKILFSTAYYADKAKKYKSIMSRNAAKGQKTKFYWGNAMNKIETIIEHHNIMKYCAYNSPFDKGAFEMTSELLNGKNAIEDLQDIDIKSIAGIIHHDKNYQEMAKENKWFTESGNYLTNAEKTYAFITNNVEYIEPHTSLQDCEIELEILNYAISKGANLDSKFKNLVRTDIPQTKIITLKNQDKEIVEQFKIKYTQMTNRKSKNEIEFIVR